MRGLTDEARGRIDRIFDRSRAAKRAVPPADAAWSLREIGRLGEPAALPYVLPFLVDERVLGRLGRAVTRWVGGAPPGVVVAARAAASELAERSSVDDLIALDRAIRSAFGAYRVTAWCALESLDLLLSGLAGEPRTAVLGLASFHANGFVREAAVRELAQQDDGAELPFLLIRLNDWVIDVRTLAQEAIRTRTSEAHVAQLVACLPLVDRLTEWSRVDADVYRALLDRLFSSSAKEALVGGTRHSDRRVRRAALRYLTEQQDAPWSDVLRRTSIDPDLTIRLWTAREVATRLPRPGAIGLLEELMEDPHLAVRKAALRGLVELKGVGAISFVRAGVLDRAGSVRELARFLLKRMRGDTDFVRLYREALESAAADGLRAAVGGLGETGAAEDAGLVVQALERARTSRDVRACLRALARLAPERARPTLWRYTVHPQRGVRRTAALLLAPAMSSADEDALAGAIAADGAEEGKDAVVGLTDRLETWPRLLALLALRARPGGELAGAVGARLRAWCHHHAHAIYAPRPAEPAELERARRRLARAQAWLGRDVHAEVAAILAAEPSR